MSNRENGTDVSEVPSVIRPYGDQTGDGFLNIWHLAKP